MFDGETCSPFRSFTTYLMKRGLRGRYRVSPGPCSTLNRVVPNETWRLWRVLLHAMPCSTLNRVVPNETFQSQVSCIPGSLLAVPSIATSPSATYRLARTSVPTVRFQSLNREQPLCNVVTTTCITSDTIWFQSLNRDQPLCNLKDHRLHSA